MASDLLGIGTSGVMAQQRLLQTTSNNIVNVNSQGYVRERTLIYTNANGLGTGDMLTERVINAYAQGEVRRDTSAFYASSTRYQQLANTDSLLGDTSNSVGAAITSYFKGFHTANEAPADISGRKATLSELSGMVNRFHTLSTQLDKQTDTINTTIGDEAKRVNSLLNSINDLNQAILRTQGSPEENLMLFDQRDEAIRQLSEKMEIRTVPQANGSMLVNMRTGHSLVLDGGVAQFNVISGDPDSREPDLQLTMGANKATINNKDIGGGIGGLFSARNDLEPSKRELGQLAAAMADAMNQQNRLGMDLDNELGGDLFSLGSSDGLAYSQNTGSGAAKVSFVPDKGTEVTTFDYEVQFSSATGYEVFSVDKDGNRTSLTTGTTPPATVLVAGHGIQIDLSGTPAAGDKILLQPTKRAAAGLGQLATRAEDLALASPLKADKGKNNFGAGEIKLNGITNTGAGSGFGANSLNPASPQVVKIDGSGNYQVYAADGTTLIGVAPASSKGQNLMAALESPLGGPKVYAAPAQTPGYEFSITGKVEAKDSFTLSYNTDGFADNANGLALADLQNKDLVRKSSNAGTSNDKMTFNEAYSGLVTGVGNNTSQAKSQLKANETKLTQSRGIFESVSGVSLEEEAANLIRYQQSYAASAQIVSTAKTIFDTLLSSVR
ncbi:flagellar basal body rod C-terminal domain-containing protein [Aeromonas hydrophila]|jgi:flagellar hook-associated protein 1 FlgK|uniref:FlgK family flagellar hook-associated protein n=1 Tax=Aeromonas hydrophila TaxID=644 RepID=UPI00049335C8|nr:flagellar basal body rod C-terminal domain-containing protein [Aeromonas hydrophila]MBC8670096.1 flagellar biosynthesis protein FlgK [Aeromonas hydrophila]MBC8687254.1 flagellar biosynthesis protein FlgK [Aeromonas hydrophila]MBM0509833.1 flagellar biosynthesis protein FlgK [Aeromonas hydrophila]MBW3771726.1 flagellar biosynthesis protein FlgK [Aeromonas hydrophila]MCP3290024.1 flagellar biosynthesis protein FlgK [Aeromonas hydrophila]